jgi:purine-binding chemotaxis protein CheW
MSNGNPGQIQERIVQMASFRVGNEEYVIDIMRIKEIINPLKITPVPSSSDLIEGMINLRGVIIPIVDLRKRFRVPKGNWAKQPKYIIVADEVLEVVRIPRDQIKPSPEISQGREPGIFLGVCEHQGRLLLLVDLKKVLDPAFLSPFEGESAGR